MRRPLDREGRILLAFAAVVAAGMWGMIAIACWRIGSGAS